MSLTLSTKTIKGVTYYRPYSTTIDKYHTKKWLTRQQMIEFMFWRRFHNFVDEVLKDAHTFPHHYGHKEGWLFVEKEKATEHYNFMIKANDDESDQMRITEFNKQLELMGWKMDFEKIEK